MCCHQRAYYPAYGFYANLPFALATGMGTNFMFGALLQSNTLSFGAIMAITLISGLIFVVLTIFGVRDLIVKAIPKNIKVAIGSAIGFYIAYLGFKNSGIGTFTNGIGMGNFKEPAVFIALLGLVIIAVLTAYRVNGAILIGIVAVTVMGIPLGVTTLPDTFAKIPDVSSWGNIVFCFDFKGLLSFQAIVYVFIAFCGDFFSTLGTVLGVAGKAGMLDEDGNMPGIQKPFLVDAIGDLCGSLYRQYHHHHLCGIHIRRGGGRQNRPDQYCGSCSLCCHGVLFAPDSDDTGKKRSHRPALIFVGFLMVSGIRNIDFSDFTEAFGPFVMIMFVIFCGSIAAGIAAGILAYIIIKTATGKFKELHPVMYVLAVPLVMYFVFK